MMTIQEIYELFLSCKNGLSTDSRGDVRNTFFIALKGTSFNGNKYAEVALKKGASYAVVDDPTLASKNKKFLLVKDTNEFIGLLANHHRNILKKNVIAIGGSNGKTTTRQMITTLLSEVYQVSTNVENENNYFGVCFTLLRTTKKHDLIVLEIGSNHVGEHKTLLTVCQPDYLLLTNNGKDHLGEYGSLRNVKKENFELYRYAKEYNKKVFVPVFEKDLEREAKRLQLQTIPFKLLKSKKGLQSSFLFNKKEITIPIFGEFVFKNIAAACAVSKELKVSSEKMIQGFRKIQPAKLRGQVVVWKGNTLVLDCYNANPTSLALALESFYKASKKPNMVIIGDMYELGRFAPVEHQNMVNKIKKLNFTITILVGKNFQKCKGIKNFKVFGNYTGVQKYLEDQTIKKNTILVKGSRGETLEKIFI